VVLIPPTRPDGNGGREVEPFTCTEGSAVTSLALRVLTPTLFAATFLGLLAGPAAVQARNPYYRAAVVRASPYWGYAWDPYYYGGALHGVAAIINAEGEFLKQAEQAKLLHEDVRRKKIETHKLELEHWEYVRDFYAGIFHRAQERNLRAELNRSMSLALTTGEIVNGLPLNRLIKELKRMELPADGSTSIPDGVLSQIVPTVNGRGNAGLLKLQKLTWPMLLRQADYKSDREEVDRLIATARKLTISTQGEGNELPQVLQDLKRLVRKMGLRLQEQLHKPGFELDWSTNDYSRAKMFLAELRDAVTVLGMSDASFYLRPLEGKTVAELVKYMKDNGIDIAPGTTGSERAYKILHTALASELRRLRPTLSTTDRP
jgi:hypothetical protein